MVHAPFEKDRTDDATSTPLAFEAEFDGVRRPVARSEEPLFDPECYWRLNSGTD